MVEKTDQSNGALDLDFITPVQFIAKLLLDLRNNYFNDETTPEVTKIRSRITYSLDKLNNKASLFSVDPDLLKTPLTVSHHKEDAQPNVNSDVPPDEGEHHGAQLLVQRASHLERKSRRHTVVAGSN